LRKDGILSGVPSIKLPNIPGGITQTNIHGMSHVMDLEIEIRGVNGRVAIDAD
jgi:hypothetical protein